jgi:hypothetical protein
MRAVGKWLLIALGIPVGLIVLLVVLEEIFPGFAYAVGSALGWLVGHIIKFFSG